ncbi:MAG: hypothetical protein FWF12_00335 [Betaproteobacteria bacterium]|nr:hypothetical protein [Betaproteobacteria bacterium]
MKQQRHVIAMNSDAAKERLKVESERLAITQGEFLEVLILHSDIAKIEAQGLFIKEKKERENLISKFRSLSREDQLAILKIVEKQ